MEFLKKKIEISGHALAAGTIAYNSIAVPYKRNPSSAYRETDDKQFNLNEQIAKVNLLMTFHDGNSHVNYKYWTYSAEPEPKEVL